MYVLLLLVLVNGQPLGPQKFPTFMDQKTCMEQAPAFVEAWIKTYAPENENYFYNCAELIIDPRA